MELAEVIPYFLLEAPHGLVEVTDTEKSQFHESRAQTQAGDGLQEVDSSDDSQFGFVV